LSVENIVNICKAFPQYHKELTEFSLHMDLSKRCLSVLKSGLLDIVKAEQNVATGINVHTKKPITSIIPELAPYLTDEDVDEMVKVRLLMLYVMLKNGSPESDIDKIFDCSDVPLRLKGYVVNMSFLGLNILTRRRVSHNRPPVKARSLQGKYESARWTPYVVDLIEDILDGTMRKDAFPIIETEHNMKDKVSPVEAPETRGGLDTQPNSRQGSAFKPIEAHSALATQRIKRIIVCFIGGVTYAEMQMAHQIAAERGVEVLIGGDDIITPSIFMERVNGLRRWTVLEDTEDSVISSSIKEDPLSSRDVFISRNANLAKSKAEGGGGKGGRAREGESCPKFRRMAEEDVVEKALVDWQDERRMRMDASEKTSSEITPRTISKKKTWRNRGKAKAN